MNGSRALLEERAKKWAERFEKDAGRFARLFLATQKMFDWVHKDLVAIRTNAVCELDNPQSLIHVEARATIKVCDRLIQLVDKVTDDMYNEAIK